MQRSIGTKEDVASAVADMFRIAEDRDGMSLKRLSLLSKVPYESLNSYRNGTAMPLHVYVAIASFLADDLLSLCIERADKHIASNEPEDGGAHDLATDSGEYSQKFAEALHPESPGGASITHIERAELNAIHRRMKARRIAA